MDTIPGDKTGENKVMQSTISRFACRILANRNNPKITRIYAAGFDTSRNIFLGVRSITFFTLFFKKYRNKETTYLFNDNFFKLSGKSNEMAGKR